MAIDPVTDAPHPKPSSTDQEMTPLPNPNRTCQVLSIPYDIFYQIVTLCWIETDDNGHDFPVLASHVCRLWRQYALDTPGFWTSLKFYHTRPEIDKYRTWLERSKDVPFDLEIGRQPFERASVKHAKAIMRLVFPRIRHLRSLRVSQVPFKIRQMIFDRINNVHLPSLETLDVERGYRADGRPALTNRKFKPFRQGDAPNLKHAVLERIPYDHVIHRFKKLETLSITNMFTKSHRQNAKTVQDILSLLPELRIFHIRIEAGDYSVVCHETPTLPPTTHSALQKLSIAAVDFDITAIVCALVLPSLRRFYHISGEDVRIDPCCLPIMVQAPQGHPYPNLLGLRLCGRQIWDNVYSRVDLRNMEFFERAMAGLKWLEFLTLESVDLDHNRHLTCLSRTCPMLKTLNFICCSGFALKELREVLQSRRDPQGMGSDCLQHVEVNDRLPTLQRLHKEAKEQSLGEDRDFNITISEKETFPRTHRILIVGAE